MKNLFLLSEKRLGCTRSCVTYMMQEGYQRKEDELLFTYRPHALLSDHSSNSLRLIDQMFLGSYKRPFNSPPPKKRTPHILSRLAKTCKRRDYCYANVP